jgi:long-chain fatty acid transport protein
MKKRILGIVASVALLAMSGSNLWATNGAQLIGFTAINESLGGSGTAAPQDVSTILLNPAGLTELPMRADFTVDFAFPKSQMNSSAAPAGNPAGVSNSIDDTVVLPGGGFTTPTPLFKGDDGEKKLFVGVAILPTAGFSVDYPTSRLTPTVTANAYDTHTFYGLLKIVPSAAYKINDKLSVGVAVHVDHAQFSTNSALPGTFAQTSGADRTDDAFGIGVGVGVLYKAFDFLSAGVSYTSEQFMKDFGLYKDLLPQGLNFPQQVNAGLAWTPIDKLLVNTDFRWINWSGATGAFGTSVANGGLGWQDQYIALIGAQYQPFDFLVLRAGYNYGRSPIPSGSVFASQLAIPIGEQHATAGVGFKLGKMFDVDFSYVRTFSHTVTDNGSQLAGLGAGSFTTQSVNEVGVQFALNFF